MKNHTDADLIARAGMVLYRTEDWARPVANFLGVDPRTMQRVAQAQREGRDYGVDPAWLSLLRDALRNQGRSFGEVAEEIEQHLLKGPPSGGTLQQLPEILAGAGGYILLERGFPFGELKADVCTAREASGRLMVFRGQISGIPNITFAMVTDWVREGRLCAEPAGPEGQVIFRPTKAMVA